MSCVTSEVSLIKKHSQVAGLKNRIRTFLHCYPFQTTGAQGYLAYCFSSLGMCCRTHFPSRPRPMFHSRYFPSQQHDSCMGIFYTEPVPMTFVYENTLLQVRWQQCWKKPRLSGDLSEPTKWSCYKLWNKLSGSCSAFIWGNNSDLAKCSSITREGGM